MVSSTEVGGPEGCPYPDRVSHEGIALSVPRSWWQNTKGLGKTSMTEPNDAVELRGFGFANYRSFDNDGIIIRGIKRTN
jgi:hypothetical protein